MRIIRYNLENKESGYLKLLKELYSSYPLVLKTKIDEWKKVNTNNPFFKFASIDNFIVFRKDQPIAHASAIIDSRLDNDIGLIGFFESINDQLAVNFLFGKIFKYFKKQNKKDIRGPINLNTWQTWRVSYPEGRPPFPSEPFTPEYYKNLFETANFDIAQENISTISPVIKSGFSKFGLFIDNLANNGIRIQQIDQNNLELALKGIFQINMEVFINSWTFAKINMEEFVYYYQNLKSAINLSYSCIALDQRRQVLGFCFALPANNSVVIKTFAVRKDYQGKNLGKALFAWLYQRAEENNIKDFIFSTMRVDNKKILQLTKGKNIYRYYRAYQKQI